MPENMVAFIDFGNAAVYRNAYNLDSGILAKLRVEKRLPEDGTEESELNLKS